MSKDILFDMRVRRICHKILNDKGKSKKVVMAEFMNRNKKDAKLPSN